MLVLFAPE